MATYIYEYTNNHWLACFKWANCMAREFCLSKAPFFNLKETDIMTQKFWENFLVEGMPKTSLEYPIGVSQKRKEESKGMPARGMKW